MKLNLLPQLRTRILPGRTRIPWTRRAGWLALLLLAGCATDRAVIRQASDTNVELKPAFLTDSELNSYLQTIGDRIVSTAQDADRRHFGPKSHFVKGESNEWMFTRGEFHLVNSKTLNAFTTGGEHMYIYNELFQQCRSEDELAAVMAHEYGHVYARHVHKGMNRQYAILGTAAFVGVAGLVIGGEKHGEEYSKVGFISAATIGTILGMGYTRDDEAEADALGFEFYSRAGWDPDRFGDFFQQLVDKGYDKTPAEQSDHPTLASRVTAAKQRAASLPPEAKSWRRPPLENPTSFAALKQRAALIAKSTPSDEQLAKAQTLLAAVSSCVTPIDQPDQKRAQQMLAQALEGGSAPPGGK